MYRYIWKIKLSDPTREAEFLNYWRDTSSLLQKFPGALGTHAHRVRDEEASFFLVAEWKTKKDRDFMSDDIHNGQSEIARKWRTYAKDDTFGEVVRFAGEEIGVVLPDDQGEKYVS